MITPPKKISAVLAKIVRVITIPPIMICTLIAILAFFCDNIFIGVTDMLMSALFLGIFPVIAYPVSYIIPKLSARDKQRNLAFVFTGIGYLAAILYGLIASVTPNLMLIYMTYFMSAVVLTIVNKVIKVRASGHACACVGPLLFLMYFISFKVMLPCLLLIAVIVWASRTLNRHSLRELALGAATSVVSFAVSILIV